MKSVGWAVAGLGWGGVPHANAAAKATNAALVGVCDLDPQRRAEWAQQSETAVYDSLDELLAGCAPEVVTVATPPQTHFAIASRLLSAGVHVVLEKPPCLTLADLDRLVGLENEADSRVFPIVQYRYHPGLRALREQIRAGDFGRIVSVIATVVWPRGSEYYRGHEWRRRNADGGGCLMNQAFHHIDLVQWLVGGWCEPTYVGSRVIAGIDRDDDVVTVAGRLDHPDGAIGAMHVSTAGPAGAAHESLFLVAERAVVEARGFRLAEIRVGDTTLDAMTPTVLNDLLYSTLTQDVAAAVQGLPSNVATLSDVRPALAVALGPKAST